MNKLFCTILLYFISFSSHAEEKTWDEKLTPEQRQAYSEFMDIPEPTDEPTEASTVETAPVPSVSIQGSRKLADEAYRNKDYETAIQHYKALAKEGDGEASVIVGTMHEEGLGTEKDPAAAHAWYKKAKDTNADDGAGSQLAESLESNSMTAEEITKAEEIYKELKKDSGTSMEKKSENNRVPYAANVNTSTAYPIAEKIQQNKVQNSFELSRPAKIIPEKYNRETSSEVIKSSHYEHYKPRKYSRQN